METRWIFGIKKKFTKRDKSSRHPFAKGTAIFFDYPNSLRLKNVLQIKNVGGLNDAFFGTDNYLANSFNISFGIDGDKLFYSDYLVWLANDQIF